MWDQLYAAGFVYREEVRQRDRLIAIHRSVRERAALEASAQAIVSTVRVTVPARAPRREVARPAWPRHITAASAVTRTPALSVTGSLGAGAPLAHACS